MSSGLNQKEFLLRCLRNMRVELERTGTLDPRSSAFQDFSVTLKDSLSVREHAQLGAHADNEASFRRLPPFRADLSRAAAFLHDNDAVRFGHVLHAPVRELSHIGAGLLLLIQRAIAEPSMRRDGTLSDLVSGNAGFSADLGKVMHGKSSLDMHHGGIAKRAQSARAASDFKKDVRSTLANVVSGDEAYHDEAVVLFGHESLLLDRWLNQERIKAEAAMETELGTVDAVDFRGRAGIWQRYYTKMEKAEAHYETQMRELSGITIARAISRS